MLIRTQPETELILLCASPVKSDERSARIRELLNGNLDWNSLRKPAESHRLMPLLYWEMNCQNPGQIPLWLKARFDQNVRNSVLLTGELVRILDLFHREGIEAIPFKGPTLAVSAYENLALRSFDDLDILLRTEDVWRAWDLLLREGFASKLRLHQGRRKAYLKSYDELMVYGPGEYPLVELHWAFVPPHFSVPLNTPALWKRTVNVSLGGREIRSLSPEDLLLVLCLHGSKHCWSHLGLVCDVAWLSSAQVLSWESILNRARELGIHRMVLLACVLALRILSVPLPEPVKRDLIADKSVPLLADEIVQALLGGLGEPGMLGSAFLHMKMRENRQDRLRYLFTLVTRPAIEDWQLIDLPSRLSFLYPVLRFPRLGLKWIRQRKTHTSPHINA